MTNLCELSSRNYIALNEIEMREHLTKLGKTWQINEHGHLYKYYRFKDFISAMNFANKITEFAQALDHHPDFIICWGECHVSIITHKIKALSINDFELANKINQL